MKAYEYLTRSYPIFNIGYSVNINANKGAVIVETRQIKYFGLIVKNHLYFLPKDYGLTVFHSNANEQFVKEQLADVIGVNYQNIGDASLNASAYNALLTSKVFWEIIPYRKVLIFQTDSLLLRTGVELFEGYDYVGAPWSHMGKEVGNGGLSLRSKQVMLDIINQTVYMERSHGNEDVYFSKRIRSVGGVIASTEVASHFAVETMFYDKPIGVHAADKWLKASQLEIIYNNSLKEFI